VILVELLDSADVNSRVHSETIVNGSSMKICIVTVLMKKKCLPFKSYVYVLCLFSCLLSSILTCSQLARI
jgi:hypothetical protein